jgi:chemosensory pili system protein ChpC
MSDKPEVLSCVLIPVQEGNLLLPNVSVAEIVDYAEPAVLTDAPAWMVGQLSWRGMSLPVISYDAANGGTPSLPQSHRGRIAVLNTIGQGHDRLPFLAIVTQGIPRQAKVEDAALAPRDGNPGPADLLIVEFEGEPTRIPNLEYLEQLAADYTTA